MCANVKHCWRWLVVVTVLCAACTKQAPVEQASRDSMLTAVNALRAAGCQCGETWMPPVPALQWNDTLAAAAKAHARDMQRNDYFSHITPAGASPIQRAGALGYAGNYVTENIGRGFRALSPLMAAWQQSEAHCSAMMDPLQTEMGAANVNTYWVQEFGSFR